jgi:hypothetical protein
MKLTKSEVKSFVRLVAQHDGLDVLPNARGIARGDRSAAYPVEHRGRVGWFRQVCLLSPPGETGRRHWSPAVIRSRRPANAVAVLRALES